MSKTSQLARNKLILLYLTKLAGIPMSNGEICQFALEKKLMDYFSVQEYLSELVEAGYLEKTKENNHTRYSITEKGSTVLSYFQAKLPNSIKTEMAQYIQENSNRIKKELEIIASYSPIGEEEFLVKLNVCDAGRQNLMEINARVPSKETARRICSNWQNHVNHLYGSILSLLASEVKKEKKSTKPRS